MRNILIFSTLAGVLGGLISIFLMSQLGITIWPSLVVGIVVGAMTGPIMAISRNRRDNKQS